MEELKERLRAKGFLELKVILFDGYELLDVYGPLEMFGMVNASSRTQMLRTKIVGPSEHSSKVRPSGGPLTLTNLSMAEAQDERVDLLFIPGGIGTRILAKDDQFLKQLALLAVKSAVIMSVCTGSLLLSAAGLLDGFKATTNKRVFREIEIAYPHVAWQHSARWVQDGKFYTSSGISAGTDLSLHLIGELLGKKSMRRCWKMAEYCPLDDSNVDRFPVVEDPKGELSSAHLTMVEKRPGNPIKVGLVVYDQFEMLDTFGPLEMFHISNAISEAHGLGPLFQVEMLSEDRLVESFEGPRFEADLTLEEIKRVVPSYSVLMLPGGVGSLRECHNPLMLRLLPQLIDHSNKVMTVCSGSSIVAATGKMNDCKATSNKLAFEILSLFGPKVSWVSNARWVVDSKFYTASGVSAGCDLSLHLIKEFFGEPFAWAVAQRAEYVWNEDPSNDPFAKDLAKTSPLKHLAHRLIKNVLSLVFNVGFTLGFKMNITKFLPQ